MTKIPNTITLCNAICGVLVILLGSPVIGAYLIIMAMILDTVDGLVARALNVKSDLGKQLDSLSDLISIGKQVIEQICRSNTETDQVRQGIQLFSQFTLYI